MSNTSAHDAAPRCLAGAVSATGNECAPLRERARARRHRRPYSEFHTILTYYRASPPRALLGGDGKADRPPLLAKSRSMPPGRRGCRWRASGTMISMRNDKRARCERARGCSTSDGRCTRVGRAYKPTPSTRRHASAWRLPWRLPTRRGRRQVRRPCAAPGCARSCSAQRASHHDSHHDARA